MRRFRAAPSLLIAFAAGAGASCATSASLTPTAPPASVRGAAALAGSGLEVTPAHTARTPAPDTARALRIERKQVVTITFPNGKRDETPSTSVMFRLGARWREDAEPYGVFPAKTTSWSNEGGAGLLVDHEGKRFAELEPDRAALAAELGIAMTADGEMDVAQPLFVEEAKAEPAGGFAHLGGGTARRFVIPRSKTGYEVWVVDGLPLTSRDHAAALGRRLPTPRSPADEALLSGFVALPGYPVFVSRKAGERVETSDRVVSIRSVDVAPAGLDVPSTYERVGNVPKLMVDMALRDRARIRAEGRARLGLDTPFVPTPAQPIPPALPGGSCKPSRRQGVATPRCREAWDGRETDFYGPCDPPFDFERPCDRAGIRGVCESADRTDLEYYDSPAGEKACDGRWYAVP